MKNKQDDLQFVIENAELDQKLQASILEFRNKLTAVQGKYAKIIGIMAPVIHVNAAYMSKMIADTFARDGEKVLLIDACMHDSKLDKFYGVTNVKTLSQMAAEELNNNDLLIKINDCLDLVIAGYTNYPTKVLQSRQFYQFINESKDRYDRIILLLPPILKYQDIFLLKDNLECVVLVGKKNETKIADIKRAIELLLSRDLPFMGTLFVAPASKNNFFKKFFAK